MRLLVIGGTKFIGRHLVATALAGDHDVTLLHRGVTGAELFADADHRLADRNDAAALAAQLADGTWDATIDVSAYRPGQVAALAAALGGRGGRYVFVSSVSVYDPETTGFAEESRVVAEITPMPDEITEETYGPLKVSCERFAQEHFDAPLVIRPTYVVGPWDRSGRFDYWVHRIAAGGDVLAPGAPDTPIQVVDARDIADFVLALLAAGRTGTFHTIGVPATYTFRDLLDDVADGVGTTPTLTWVDTEFLLAAGVTSDLLPLWAAGDATEELACTADPAASLAAGFHARRIADSARDALATGKPPPDRLSAEREAELLALFRSRASSPSAPSS